MQILTRYLLKYYLQLLILTIFSFIGILLCSQLEEIVQFAATGAKISYLLLFTFYQIPYILPIGLPISCLISSFILCQRLSHAYEMTALRSSGIALKKILAPVLMTAAFISFFTLYITSEIATSSHLATRTMMHEISSVNPLVLLQSAKIVGLRDAFIQMDPLQNGKAAHHVILAIKNPDKKNMSLLLTKKMQMDEGILIASELSAIMVDSAEQQVLIENCRETKGEAKDLANLISHAGWRMANDHLKLRLLIMRLKYLIDNQESIESIHKCYSEMFRRLSVGLGAFTFTLMGCAYGLSISRTHLRSRFFKLIALIACALTCFCMGKTYSHHIILSPLFYFVPHIIMIFSASHNIKRLNEGR